MLLLMLLIHCFILPFYHDHAMTMLRIAITKVDHMDFVIDMLHTIAHYAVMDASAVMVGNNHVLALVHHEIQLVGHWQLQPVDSPSYQIS